AAAARKVFDNLQRIWRATDLGRIKSVATIPAISTHQQQGEEGRDLAGIPPNLIRLCVGAEHYQDIIDDLDQALNGLDRCQPDQAGRNKNTAKEIASYFSAGGASSARLQK
ncbi:MAG: PLP-dependent transferase, partial [Desulfobacterales bacterium]|nr:PLP-dependent transferase [Desulfobacterales bacterium]